VKIASRLFKAAVSQQHLDGAQIRIGIEKVSCKCVTIMPRAA
jgi:hypothetical protein